MGLRLYDTARRAVVPFEPDPIVRMYVCGITPYDATHMGHAATYVAFDLVQRVWLDAGHDVHYVQNVTDVDDPLLARALGHPDQAIRRAQWDYYHMRGAPQALSEVLDGTELVIGIIE